MTLAGTTMQGRSVSRFAIVASALLLGCSERKAPMPEGPAQDYSSIGLEFVKALASREYPTAYAMTSSDYQRSTTLDQMRLAFEAIVPTDWRAGTVEVGQTMQTWPDKKASDVGWVYVGIGGDVYSEAVTVIVMLESGAPKIRTVEFGRP